MSTESDIVGKEVSNGSKQEKQWIVPDIDIPQGITVSLSGNIINVIGKLGKLQKDFTKIPADVKVEESRVIVKPIGTRKKHYAIANTARNLIANMIKGVEKGYTYRLKIAYAHFPIAVKIKGKEVHVENFFGERSARVSKIIGDSKVSVAGDDVIVQGPSLENVSQTAANIESSTRIRGKDNRVFLDGIYIYAKEEGIQ
jgi:large subunit ribosomal protein L6